MKSTLRSTRRVSARRPSRRASRPTLLALESRQLLASGFLQGSVFNDLNANNRVDAGEAIGGATVDLYDSTGTTLLGSRTTNAQGYYLFDGVAPGDYRLQQTPPSGYTPQGTGGYSPINPILPGGTANAINVRVTDPSQLNRVQFNTADEFVLPFGVVSLQASKNNGASYVTQIISTSQLPIVVSGPGLSSPSPKFISFCVDPFNLLTEGKNDFQTVGKEVPSALDGGGNAGRVAYLYNRYGLNPFGLPSKLTKIQASGLQLALYELTLDATPDFNSGNFKNVQALPAFAAYTTPSELTSILAQAMTYINESVGKSERAIFLDVEGQPLPTTGGRQGVIASSVLNFTNIAAASLSGSVYVDSSNDGVFDPTEAPIAGVPVTLTGSNDRGPITPITVYTNAVGTYAFTGLRPGTYTITEAQPSLYADGIDTQGTPGNGVTGNDIFANITLGSGVNGLVNNFGERPASLAGSVYVDADNDGAFDSGETPIANVEITLTGSDLNGAPVNLTTYTLADGSYRFDDLPAGTYAVIETQPAAYLDGKDTIGTPGGATTNDAFSAVVLPAGFHGLENNFGEVLASSISGYVYHDANNNGSRSGDAGIAGVAVTLTGADDRGTIAPVTVYTSADGAYSFDGLRPGTYTVSEVQPAAYLDGIDTAGSLGGSTAVNDVVSAILLPAGAASVENNFGEVLASSISGYVYHDANNNGGRTGDAGIPNVAVTLTGSDDLGPIAPITAYTDANGFYAFNGLRPGTYAVIETQPAAYLDGIDTIGTPGGATANDAFSAIVLPAGFHGLENNFGEIPPATITGFVFLDHDDNGLFGTGEAPIQGVEIALSGLDDLNQPVYVITTTDADGFYAFTGLRPGTYFLIEAQPSGYLDGSDTYDNDNPVLGSKQFSVLASETLSGFVTTPGSIDINNNFGELEPASISGYVYHDAGNDGSRAGDGGIANVAVTLTGSDDRGAITPITVFTAADGSYAFHDLRPGTYAITEAQPGAYLDGKDTIGTPGGATANDAFSAIVLPAGFHGLENNFGEILASSISGYVYHDANNNGGRTGDAGIAGIAVTLTGADDRGAIAPVTAYTSADGSYSFDGLRPGTYTVSEAQSSAYLDGIDTAGSLGGSTAVNDRVGGIVLPAGAASVENNFGEILGGTISGRKFRDLTGNGLTSDDTGLGQTTIFIDLNNNGSFESATEPSAVTAADGSYSIANLAPGSYIVREVLQGNYVRTGPVLQDYYSVTVGNGQTVTGKDFANYLKCNCTVASVSYTITGAAGTRTVTDLRGKVDPGDTVTATFTVSAGKTIELSLVTYTAPEKYFNANNASEQQIFDLETGTFGPGTHTMTVLVPNSFFQVDFVCGSAIDRLGPAGSNIFYSAQNRLISADNDGTAKVGTSSLAGFVYVDADNDGVFDSGETPISNVTITLTGKDKDGNTVNRTAVTDANGGYKFDNLPVSDTAGYTLVQGQPNGYNDGKDTIGSQGGTASNDRLVTVRLNTNTNGVNNNFGELLDAAIGDLVWEDLDRDGLREAGENGVSGLTVKLTGTDTQGNKISRTTTTSNGTTDVDGDGTVDPIGSYYFGGLKAGSYVVTFTPKTNYQFTAANVGTNEAIDSDADINTGATAMVTLAPGQINRNVDAGIFFERLGCEGGTPGYWKNNAEKKGASAWGPTGLSPSQKVSSVFASTAGTSLGNKTLLEALGLNGGGTNALIRQAVAALLNALHPDVYYAKSSTWVVSNVNAAVASGSSSKIEDLKDRLDDYNNAYHPLDQSGRRD